MMTRSHTASAQPAVEPSAFTPRPLARRPLPKPPAAPHHGPPVTGVDIERVTNTNALTEELRLVRAAHAATLRGDGKQALELLAHKQALELLAQHARRFPGGQLVRERGHAEISALCAMGQPQRAQRAAQLLGRRGTKVCDTTRTPRAANQK